MLLGSIEYKVPGNTRRILQKSASFQFCYSNVKFGNRCVEKILVCDTRIFVAATFISWSISAQNFKTLIMTLVLIINMKRLNKKESHCNFQNYLWHHNKNQYISVWKKQICDNTFVNGRTSFELMKGSKFQRKSQTLAYWKILKELKTLKSTRELPVPQSKQKEVSCSRTWHQ